MVNRGTIPAKELRISQESTNRMSDTIIDNTNAVVGPDDHLVIIGDFCWTPRDDRFGAAKRFRDRVNCKNLYLIWGNHDDRRVLSPLFRACYDQYVFNVDGQHIFSNHYPCRSWDGAHHGYFMVYGHVHDLYHDEDNGDIMPYQKKVFSEGFDSVLRRYNCITEQDADRQNIVNDLLAVVASLNGIDLTVDVGVDNQVRGLPFGQPWSMDDLRHYMAKKKLRWDARSDGYRSLADPSSLKGGNPKADPKF